MLSVRPYEKETSYTEDDEIRCENENEFLVNTSKISKYLILTCSVMKQTNTLLPLFSYED
jgi:hypothetical protein